MNVQYDPSAARRRRHVLLRRAKRRAYLGAAFLCSLAFAPHVRPQTLLDDHEITISDQHSAIARRKALITYLWGSSGFPTQLPTRIASIKSPVANLSNLDHVDQLTATMEHNEFSIAYHFVPRASNGRVVILQNGHRCSFGQLVAGDTAGHEHADGLGRTIDRLLSGRFSVLAAFMPRDTPASNGMPANCTSQHDEMFAIHVANGNPMKFFLEPTAVFINYLKQKAAPDGSPAYNDYSMVGLSGGGWTTTLYAAIDPTISLSIPVAGSLPLYLRCCTGSIGDEEQFDAGFYQIAGYPDLYVLGSAGPGRRQVQVLNRRDTCCFGQNQFNVTGTTYDEAVRAYELRVRAAVKAVGSGSFSVEIDDAKTWPTAGHSRHQISWNVLFNVILPQLNGESVVSPRRGGGAR